MLSLLKKPTVTVEQIHAEFDSAQERLLAEPSRILNNLQIERQIENKGEDLKSLGFVKSEVVTRIKGIQEARTQAEDLARRIQYFKMKYPYEKFITVDELERICKKYNLVHAPVAHYIKAGIFKEFHPYQTKTGFYLGTLKEAMEFNNYHEGIHLGIMMSIKKFL